MKDTARYFPFLTQPRASASALGRTVQSPRNWDLGAYVFLHFVFQSRILKWPTVTTFYRWELPWLPLVSLALYRRKRWKGETSCIPGSPPDFLSVVNEEEFGYL